MRFVSIFGAVAAGLCVVSAAQAQVPQMQLDLILHELTASDVTAMRSTCATGGAPRNAANARAAGVERPEASAWCVTVLTRLGRDGTLGYVRDPRSDKPTPALAFDSGFVGGYHKHELPAEAPTMATLLPIAERCLAQTEADIDLCNAAGQMLGARAAQGEVITLR